MAYWDFEIFTCKNIFSWKVFVELVKEKTNVEPVQKEKVHDKTNFVVWIFDYEREKQCHET